MKFRRTVGGLAALATVAGGSALVALSAPSNAGSVTVNFPAQGSGDGSVEVLSGNGGVTGIVAKEAIARPSHVGNDPRAAAEAHLDKHAPSLGVNAADLSFVSSGEVGTGTVVKVAQELDGKPVVGGEFVVSMTADGGLEAIVGKGVTSEVASVADPLTQAAGVDVAKAFIAKNAEVDASALTAEFQGEEIVNRAIFVSGAGDAAHTTLKYQVYDPSYAVDYNVWVSQATGAVTLHESRNHDSLNRKVCDLGSEEQANSEEGRCIEGANEYTIEEGAEGGEGDAGAIYDHMRDTAQWYANYADYDLTEQIGLEESDGKALRASVGYCDAQFGCPMVNAFWSNQFNQFYVGEDYISHDVTAHELTHGVTTANSGLKYIYQSGAINESLSDAFGAIIDLAANQEKIGTEAAWRHGDEMDHGGHRDLRDPTMFEQPDRMTSEFWWDMADFNDGGGVHTNSGVGNKFTYLIAEGDSFNGYEIQGVGLAKAFKILWTTQNLLTSGSDYKDLFYIAPLACRKNIDRTGTFITEEDCEQVDKAVRATEMYMDAPGSVPAAVPYCDEGSVNAAYSNGFDSADDLQGFTGEGGVGLSNADYQFGYENRGEDALLMFTQPDPTTSVIEMVDGVEIPEGAMLRLDYATEFGSGPGDTSTTAALEYDAGNGWASVADLGGENVGPYQGYSYGWSNGRVDLSSLAGQTVRFRVNMNNAPEDGSASIFWMDNLKIYTCG